VEPATTRVLRLLGLLQSRPDWTGPALAARLRVSTRTVRQDVSRLRDLGYVVDAVPGVAGGYRLGAGRSLPPLLLDEDEVVAVAVGLANAAQAGVERLDTASSSALFKLEQVMPPRLRRRARTLAAYTVAVPRDARTVDADLLTAVSAACRDHESLRMDYRAYDGRVGRRLVEPHRLVHAQQRWYLVGWDTDAGDWRTFRVDRISLRTPNGPRFTPREPPADLPTYVQRGIATASWRTRARVTVDAPASVVAARLPATIAVEAVGDRTCVIEVGSDDPMSLAGWLSLLGADFSVDGPPELGSALGQLGARLQRAARVKRPTRRPSR
jgi:predicted DNA-binding transcriptional regulator YafY